MSDAPQEPRPTPTRPPNQFDLSGLLMVVLVASVMAGAGYYLAQSQLLADKSQRISTQFVFIILTLAGPMVLMIVVSLIRGAIGKIAQWRSRT